MSKTWRVLFRGTGGLSNASARSRVFCYLKHLEAQGIRAHVASYPFHRAHTNRSRFFEILWLELLPLRNVIEFLRADAVYFYRLNFSRGQVRLARLLGKRIIHDFDDAVFLEPPDSADYGTRHAERAEKLDWILDRADVSLVSTPPLEEYAKRIARDVRKLPSVFAEIASEPSTWHEPPVIGWVGAPENQRYLRSLESVLIRLQREHPSLEVWIVTRELMDPPPSYRHKFWPWSLEAEAKIIPRFTAGIAPLDDDEWCRAKMNFKTLVCMSHGVPCVTSPVGFPLEEFAENRSVLVAVTEEDWYGHLKTLITDPARRNEIAEAGLRVIRERFSAEARVGEFSAALGGKG